METSNNSNKANLELTVKALEGHRKLLAWAVMLIIGLLLTFTNKINSDQSVNFFFTAHAVFVGGNAIEWIIRSFGKK